MRDLTGQKYGDLIVLGKSKERHPSTGEILWNTKCRCGRSTQYRTSKLVTRKSCGECTSEERTRTFENEARVAALKKDRTSFSSLELHNQLNIINDYCFGASIQELSDKHGIDKISCRDGITAYRERLNTMYELDYLARVKKTSVSSCAIDRALAVGTIEKDLEGIISSDDSEELTLQEELYCYLYVYTGSNDLAIKESGFKDVIPKDNAMKRQLLGMFLREKPNLKAYISILKDARVQEVKSSKQIVQHELINQVEQLKELLATRGTSTDRGHLLRAIELLGKTVGAFEDRLRVTELNANDALDELLDMCKREVEAGGSRLKALPDCPTVDIPYTEVEEEEED